MRYSTTSRDRGSESKGGDLLQAIWLERFSVANFPFFLSLSLSANFSISK